MLRLLVPRAGVRWARQLSDAAAAAATEAAGAVGYRISPLTASCGAEIFGPNLGRPLDAAQLGAIRAALLAHGVVFFRDQELSLDAHVELASLFGEIDRHPIVRGLESHPDVIEIVREVGAATNFGETWHTDNSYMPAPSLGSILVAREVPPWGNDTLFASMNAVYDGLSPGLQAMLDGLEAVHSASAAFDPATVKGGAFADDDAASDGGAAAAAMTYERTDELSTESVHPVVRTHDETGRKGLYVNSMFTLRFAGMTEEDSAPLLKYLCAQVERPEVQCRFRWAPGSVAFWDNRAVQHLAIGDNSSHRRVMQRVTLEGPVPA